MWPSWWVQQRMADQSLLLEGSRSSSNKQSSIAHTSQQNSTAMVSITDCDLAMHVEFETQQPGTLLTVLAASLFQPDKPSGTGQELMLLAFLTLLGLLIQPLLHACCSEQRQLIASDDSKLASLERAVHIHQAIQEVSRSLAHNYKQQQAAANVRTADMEAEVAALQDDLESLKEQLQGLEIEERAAMMAFSDAR
eukprot:scaffold27192_cov18-Tisochrysis_lutea.AAC.1